jgi:hypothetical protein
VRRRLTCLTRHLSPALTFGTRSRLSRISRAPDQQNGVPTALRSTRDTTSRSREVFNPRDSFCCWQVKWACVCAPLALIRYSAWKMLGPLVGTWAKCVRGIVHLSPHLAACRARVGASVLSIRTQAQVPTSINRISWPY